MAIANNQIETNENKNKEKEVKQYIKSIFGATSPQYKQVSGLEFKVVKND